MGLRAFSVLLWRAEGALILLADQPLDVLVAAILRGGVYVNVHTNDGVDPPGTGPGDFPSGEVRGQVLLQ